MNLNARLWFLMVLAVIFVVFGVDYAAAQSGLGRITMTYQLKQPSVVADGKSELQFVVTVAEEGRARAGDLCQIWIDVGGGVVLPEWVRTDANGQALITYRPNTLSQYEVQNKAVVHVRDTSIGRLIEVGKDVVVNIPLEKPKQQQEKSIFD